MMLDLTADVLVVGGGPAATWAGLTAAQAGADVVLADKGYCGTSGATASAGTGVRYVPPAPDRREAAMAGREGLGGYLADRRWMARVLGQTSEAMGELAELGRYPFPRGDDGRQLRQGLQGPEYLRQMRVLLRRVGVRVLDHSPVTEPVADASGAVAGAAGYRRQQDTPYRVRAGAVVPATGGCAFSSGALGCDVDTGDGAMMTAEAGAALSGMQFSNADAIAPKSTSVTKTACYSYATFFHEDGSVLEGAGSRRGRSVIALGGTGGNHLTGDDCSTGVPGLYAAGDAATRELICGGFTGGGSHNAAWAMASGIWAGRAAAAHARSLGPHAGTRRVHATGTAGLRPVGKAGRADGHREVVDAVQREVLPYDKNYLRDGSRLEPALAELDHVGAQARESLFGTARDAVRARQAAAMVAHARWMYTAAPARTEARGMHTRADFPRQDPGQHHRLLTGGLDEPWVRPLAGAAERVAS